HLVIEALEARGHFVVDGPGDNHQIRLPRRGAEGAGAEAVQIEARRTDRHHLDRAARQPERHRPDRVLPPPVDHEIKAGDDEAFFEAVFDPGHINDYTVKGRSLRLAVASLENRAEQAG